jgi:hypothetical protein
VRGLKPGSGDLTTEDISRWCFELATLLGCLAFFIFQIGGEVKNASAQTCWRLVVLSSTKPNLSSRNLKSAPPKLLFVISCVLFLGCIPARAGQLGEEEATWRTVEEAFLIFAVPGSWFYLMFFCGAIKLTGPFVTMIFKMVTGDMFTFSIVYTICLLGFSQAFFFIIKSHEDAGLYVEYYTTWIGKIIYFFCG